MKDTEKRKKEKKKINPVIASKVNNSGGGPFITKHNRFQLTQVRRFYLHSDIMLFSAVYEQ